MPTTRVVNLSEDQVLHAMTIDDSYTVERVLARGKGGLTELVSIDGIGPFIRVRMPIDRVRRTVWAALSECESMRLPRVALTYEMPDEFVAVYDYIPGDTLEHMVELRGKLDEETACKTLRELCEAVANLHEHGIIHCDLTPSNVIIAADGVHLIDMDIARMAGEPHKSEGRPLGTWGFAPPEQFGFAPVDERSDVYTLGRLLMYMLSGSDMGENAYDQDAIDLGNASRWLVDVCYRASATEPSKRFQTVRELLKALDEGAFAFAEAGAVPVAGADAGEPVPISPVPTEPPTTWEAPRKTHPWRARLRNMHPLSVLAYIAAIGCVVFGVVASVSFLYQSLLADSDAIDGVQHVEDDSARSGGDEGIVDPSGGSAAHTDAKLVVTEYGWHADEHGYIYYGVGIACEGDFAIEYPSIQITGYDADGNVLFAEEQTFGVIGAGETQCYAGISGNGSRPERVEITAIQPESYQISAAGVDVSTYAVEGVSTVQDAVLGTTFTGEVVLVDEGSSPLMSGDVLLSVILRDAKGEIEYGNTGFASAPAQGERRSFEVSCPDAPAYETLEVYAVAW